MNKNTWKPEITKEHLKEFDEWCSHGIRNYPNFPVGRTDKLGKNIVAQFIVYKLKVDYELAENSEYDDNYPSWHDSIVRYWINRD